MTCPPPPHPPPPPRPTRPHYCRKKDPKFIYYLSAEFLMGRTLTNAVNNLGLTGEYAKVGRPTLVHTIIIY